MKPLSPCPVQCRTFKKSPHLAFILGPTHKKSVGSQSQGFLLLYLVHFLIILMSMSYLAQVDSSQLGLLCSSARFRQMLRVGPFWLNVLQPILSHMVAQMWFDNSHLQSSHESKPMTTSMISNILSILKRIRSGH